MRIGVLEWASCGGHLDRPIKLGSAGELSDCIRREGWAMCSAVIESLRCAGMEPVTVALPDLIRPLHANQRAAAPELRPLDPHADVRQQWFQAYSTCERTIVIAPESAGVLYELEGWCRAVGISTCGSDDQFLRAASDKWLTAESLFADGIPHPHTWLLDQFERHLSASEENGKWVIKPRDGVGCEGIRIHRRQDLAAAIEAMPRPLNAWIIQPWLQGWAMSRAAIFDASGKAHWLPATRQRLVTCDPPRSQSSPAQSPSGATIEYRGGTVMPKCDKGPNHRPAKSNDPQSQTMGQSTDDSRVREWLHRSVRALGGQPRGWVGIDYLVTNAMQALDCPICVIEINPRLTSSFTGLVRAGAPELAGTIVNAVSGCSVCLPKNWHSLAFSL